jgi:glycosyltransferase involved in cell wall biosynthesis
MRVTHIITRLVVGGAQENTLATVRGLRARPGLDVKLISGPTIGPEGSLEKSACDIFSLVPTGEEGRGENFPNQSSRFEPLNPLTRRDATLSPTGGEGRVRGRSGCVEVHGKRAAFLIVPELVRPVHPLKDLLALRKLEKILREQKPDIVHTHSGKAGILGRLAAKRAGVPVIIHHIHGPSFGPFQGTLANFVFTAAEKHAARVTDHFFCSANAMTRIYLAAGIGKPEMFTRIFSGFDVESFAFATNDPTLRARLGFASDDFIIGKISRFVPRKGHADLFEALKLILPQCPKARLLLVGDGPLRPQMEAGARRLGLADKIIFTGLVPPSEVPRYVGIMDCLAHLSTFPEALSRALPQALAAGKPVVAYDFDGADEVCIENQTGFLIRSGDMAAAAKRLSQLADDSALRERLGRAGQAFVKNNFPVEKMVEDQYAVYLKLAAAVGVQASACPANGTG